MTERAFDGILTAPGSTYFGGASPLVKVARIVVGVELDHSGQALLGWATRFSRAVDAEELVVVHSYVRETMVNDDALQEVFRNQRLLDLFRFLSKADLHGVACTPIVEESAAPHEVLARIAGERRADLVMVGKGKKSAARIAGRFLESSRVPLVQVVLPDLDRGWKGILRRVFSQQEPAFN